MSNVSSVSPSQFYGGTNTFYEKLTCDRKDQKDCRVPYKIRDLVNGPSTVWKVFTRQVQVLEFISTIKSGLMAFAFERSHGRLFLVAHPDVFWHYDEQSPPSCRCAYEIIPELTSCKLYFDLEFDRRVNPSSNGPKMVQTLISIVSYYLKKLLRVHCEVEHVLILDSSTESKFSRHLIYNIPGTYFSNNYHAGNFVIFVCQEIQEIVDRNELPQDLVCCKLEDFLELIVKNSKEKVGLFVDEGVYTKNRQFRLYKSTKYGKFAPLLVSSDNKFEPQDMERDKGFFFSSLISYIPENVDNLRILEFFGEDNRRKIRGTCIDKPPALDVTSSPYSSIDEFILGLVSPGRIYRSVYFASHKTISYDITGNRYCDNIGRQHKSNNVKYIVNLSRGSYYQKCYDVECGSYRSEERLLPQRLQLKEGLCPPEQADHLGSFHVASSSIQEHSPNHSFQKFPSFDLHEEDFLNLDGFD